MIEGPLITTLPASFLQLHSRLEVMLDEAAARELNGN
jgi:6-phosphogluconolactonase/glucosamine-6-phosphate isomerase/deaminase